METRDTYLLLLEKYLGDRINKVIRSAEARCVLITSPRKSTGKTLFIKLIKSYMQNKWPDTYIFIAFNQLRDIDPEDYLQYRVLIDGFALNEGEESLNLPERWQKAIDAAVLLVMGRDTNQADINEGIARLHAMSVRPIGVVFNALHCPAWSEIWPRISFWRKKPVKRKFTTGSPIEVDGSKKSMGYLKLDGLVKKEDPKGFEDLDKKG